MLSTLALKKRWVNKRKAAGKDYSNPNIVMNSAVQVCWEWVFDSIYRSRRVLSPFKESCPLL